MTVTPMKRAKFEIEGTVVDDPEVIDLDGELVLEFWTSHEARASATQGRVLVFGKAGVELRRRGLRRDARVLVKGRPVFFYGGADAAADLVVTDDFGEVVFCDARA